MDEKRKNQIVWDMIEGFNERMFLNVGGDFELSDWEEKKVADLVEYILKEHKLFTPEKK